MSQRVIAAWRNGKEISLNQISGKERKAINQLHKEAHEKEITWGWFGGILTVGNLKVQVG